MSLLENADQAEVVAENYLKRKYPKRLGKIRFGHVMLDNGVWTVKANVEAGSILSSSKKSVLLRIDSRTTNVVGYSDEMENV
ncbi:MAG TPA: hypothetical protein VEC02_02315 [Nitrososphaerales archaeon]|nr:hypothetical protein [Nitrososphaerales archaeon]